MKRLLTLAVFMTAIFTLIGCGLRDSIDDTGSIFDDKETLFGFSALSSVMKLHNDVTETEMQASQAMQLSYTTQNDTIELLSEIDALTPYLELVSTFMGGESNFDVDVTTSSHADYEHQMIISTVNMDGTIDRYTMHYNETFDNDDETVDPEEYDSVIEGIMIIDDVTYTLYGERQIDEGEEALELVAKYDDDTYVTLDYEIEIDADDHTVEFDYEVFKDNELVMSIELEFAQSDEETEISLKLIRGTREIEYDFEVERDENNERTIEIEYKISEDGSVIEEGEADIIITYDEQTDRYVIRYTIKTDSETVTVDVAYR